MAGISFWGKRVHDDQASDRKDSNIALRKGHLRVLKKTYLFYMHVDGQPVDSSKWFQPNPYQPVLKEDLNAKAFDARPSLPDGEVNMEWRVFARSAADDKGPISMFLAAWDVISEEGITPDFNIKILLDPEEEIGSPMIKPTVQKNKPRLEADGLIIMDGPMHASNLPTLIFGARGTSSIRLTTYGPVRSQHSGHFGNYAPNPAFRLVHILASIKGEDGRVKIPGFYDAVKLDEKLKKQLAAVPDSEEALKERLGVGEVDRVGANLQEALQYPSFNIRGMASAWVGKETRTIIPATATAEIDMRLVKEVDPVRLMRLVKAHIQDQGFYVLDREPSAEERLKYGKIVRMDQRIGYKAFRTEMDAPIGKWLRTALNYTYGKDPIMLRTMGGSVPISPMLEVLDMPAIVLPLVNSDNNQHSPNENLRLGNYFGGIRTLVGVLSN